MKRILLLSLCMIIATSAVSFSQKIPKTQWDSLLKNISQENFRSSAVQAEKYLLSFTKDDRSLEKALLVYIDIFSHSGMVSLKQETFDELKQNIELYIGQQAVLPGFPVSLTETPDFNKIHLYDTDTTTGFVAASNAKANAVLCFCFFTFKKKLNTIEFLGRSVEAGGTIEKIEINQKKSLDWILRLTFKNAYIFKDEKR